MAVYVDDAIWDWQGLKWCHLLADTEQEKERERNEMSCDSGAHGLVVAEVADNPPYGGAGKCLLRESWRVGVFDGP